MRTFAIVAALALALGGSALATKDAPTGGGEVWLPLHVPAAGEKWAATAGGAPAWQAMYAKQYYQTAFKLCGLWQGRGEALLSYPEAGDPVYMDYDTPTAMCITTSVATGGGEHPFPLQVYLRTEGPGKALTVRSPNVFVLNQ